MSIVAYSEPSETRRTFRIEVPPVEVDRVREAVTQRLARRASLPGFRKGHVPPAVVARKFAAEIREEVLEQLIPGALEEAIREKGIEPIGRPKIADLRFEEGQPLAFEANLDVRPAIPLPAYEGIEADDLPAEPTEAEIEEMLRRIADSHAEFLPIEGRPARDGDYAIVDVAHRFVDAAAPVIVDASGAPASAPEAGPWEREEKLLLEVGEPDNMPEINEALRGASPGEVRSFRKTFAPDFRNEKYRGRTLDYEVTAVALKEKKLPALDDEFARHLGEEGGIAPVRGRIAERISGEKQALRRRKIERQILDVLSSGVNVPLPEALVDAEVESALEEYAAYLSGQGADPQAADWNRLAADARPGAERRVRDYLLLDEVARRESLEVSSTEVDAEVRSRAERRGVGFGEYREHLEREGRLSAVRQELRLRKATDWLIAHARLRPAEAERK